MRDRRGRVHHPALAVSLPISHATKATDCEHQAFWQYDGDGESYLAGVLRYQKDHI